MFKKGDLVRHGAMPSWGIGSVVAVVQGGNLQIRFAGCGEKVISPSRAPLDRVPEDDLAYLVVRAVRVKRGRAVVRSRVIPVLKKV